MKMSRLKLEVVRSLLTITALCAIAIAGQSCSDESVQQYRANQAQADAAALAPYAGTYKGTVNSSSNSVLGPNSPLGTMSVTLSVNTKSQPSSDGLTTEQSSSLQGSVTYSGVAGITNATVLNATANPPTGSDSSSMTLTAPIVDDTGVSHTLTMTGSLSNGNWTGTINVDNDPDYEGSFDLSSGGGQPTVSSSALELTSRAQALNAEIPIYYSTATEPAADGHTPTYTLQIIDMNSRSDEEFLQVFLPRHDVNLLIGLDDVPYNFNKGAGGNPPQLVYNVQTSSWSASATGGVKSGGTSVSDAVSCYSQPALSQAAPTWTCTIGDVIYPPFQTNQSGIQAIANAYKQQ